MADPTMTRLRLVFADRGTFHVETVSVPSSFLGGHERLIDVLREEAGVLRELHVDPKRLVSAVVVRDEG